MRKHIYIFLFLLVGYACDSETSDDEKKQKTNEEELSTEAQNIDVSKYHLTKVIADGEVLETYEYKYGRLEKWNSETLKTYSYRADKQNGDKVSKIEIWEENLDDQLEKIGERVYTYQDGKVNKIVEYEIEDGTRSAIQRIEIEYSEGRIKESRTYDLFEEETLEVRSMYFYRSEKLHKIENFRSDGNLYERIEYEYWNAANPFSMTGALSYHFNDLEPVSLFAIKQKKTTKMPDNNTITESWENTVIENGILKKGVLTLPREGESVIYEFVYESF